MLSTLVNFYLLFPSLYLIYHSPFLYLTYHFHHFTHLNWKVLRTGNISFHMYNN